MNRIQNVKLIGANGQITLGKQYAGRQVLIEEKEPGVWLIRTATIVPDNEQWLHDPQTAESLQKAMAWSIQHPPSDEASESVMDQLIHEKH